MEKWNRKTAGAIDHRSTTSLAAAGPDVLPATVALASALGGAEPPCAATPDEFFPSAWKPATDALSLCQQCPGRLACRELAEALGVREGIWGGQRRTPRGWTVRMSGGAMTENPSTESGLQT